MTDDAVLRAWFFEKIFPLEGSLTRFLRRNWRNESDLADLRQEIYARVYAAAQAELPSNPKAFLFACARNHLINHVKRASVVSIVQVIDLESAIVDLDAITPERITIAREELQQVQSGLDRLPRRCREIMILRKVEGLSIKETAARLGVSANNIEQQTAYGMRALVDFMMGGSGRIRRSSVKARSIRGER